jgi:hypothetical protein
VSKTPDEIRRELDGGPNVVELRPRRERPERRLATVWADESRSTGAVAAWSTGCCPASA